MGKFIITEEEKKNILSKYGIINEATGDWSKYPCVINLYKKTRGSTQETLQDGSFVYKINGVRYYNTGRKKRLMEQWLITLVMTLSLK